MAGDSGGADMEHLELTTTMGFSGSIAHGLKAHPKRQHIIYPVGCMMIVEDIATKHQDFLIGHSNTISCLDVSRSGNLIASGQVTFMGFKAEVIIWDFETRAVYAKLVLHRNSVEAVCFTYNDKYLISLGGQDDASVVLWNVAAKDALCGSPAQMESSGVTYCLACASTTDDMFVTAGRDTLRIWKVCVDERKLYPTDISINRNKRLARCIYIDDKDKYLYIGTTSGDVVIINIAMQKLRGILPPPKKRFNMGVTAIGQFKSGEFVVGAGDGVVCLCDPLFNRTNHEVKLAGAVSSISLRGEWHQFYVGTSISNIYRFNHVNDFKPQLISTSHHQGINDVAFAFNCSQIVATCGFEDIRIWNLNNHSELLRITVPNVYCHAVTITVDGKSIISGWSDCRIRSYYPETGRPMYVVNKAYGSKVTAVAAYHNCQRFISGSNLGHVVVWEVPEPNYVTEVSYGYKHFLLKEHKAEVTCIKIRRNDSECITSSIDGSCVIWDLEQRSRRHMLRVNTLFKYVVYHPLEHQVVTTGTDRKIGFWETYDGSLIRELDGSLTDSVNTLDVSEDGVYIVSGGSDKLIKLWLYDQGEVTHVGIGHSATITRVAIAPHQNKIVSCSADGVIFVWSFPTVPPPPVDVMASNPAAIEAAAERHEEDDDRCLEANRADDIPEPACVVKAGVLLPMSDTCLKEVT